MKTDTTTTKSLLIVCLASCIASFPLELYGIFLISFFAASGLTVYWIKKELEGGV